MDVTVEPPRGLVDEPAAFVVRGVPPGGQVDLTLSTTDAARHAWRHEAPYRVGAGGALDLPDPDRPWWDMAFTDTTSPPVAFSAPDTELEYTVEVRAHGDVATTRTTRCWGRGLSRDETGGDGWRLRVYRPAGDDRPRHAVLVVPGTTGIDVTAPVAALLASHGAVAGVLASMQEPGLPASFRGIPVEAAIAGLAALADRAGVDPSQLGVVAYSVGTTFALAALSGEDAPRVASVAVVAPSTVVWQAFGDAGPPPRASSLTRGGRDLPYVPLRSGKLLGQLLRTAVARRLPGRPRSGALRMHDAFAAALTHEAGDARIPVERIDAPLLAVAGDEDAMWPAATMAADITARRARSDDQLLVLPGAGHFLRPPATPSTVDRNADLVSGGTPVGIAHGQRQGWDALRAHLARTLPV